MKTCFTSHPKTTSFEEQESNKSGVNVKPVQTLSAVGSQNKDWDVGSGPGGGTSVDDNLGRKRPQDCEGNGEEMPGFKEEVAK